jgi:hypothetical protein
MLNRSGLTREDRANLFQMYALAGITMFGKDKEGWQVELGHPTLSRISCIAWSTLANQVISFNGYSLSVASPIRSEDALFIQGLVLAAEFLTQSPLRCTSCTRNWLVNAGIVTDLRKRSKT